MNRFTRLMAAALSLSLAAALPSYAADDAPKPKKEKKEGAGVGGKVVSAGEGKIVVQGRGKNAGEVTIQVDANTKFEGEATKLEDIKPGMVVMASPGAGKATKVVAKNAKPRGEGKPKKEAGAAK